MNRTKWMFYIANIILKPSIYQENFEQLGHYSYHFFKTITNSNVLKCKQSKWWVTDFISWSEILGRVAKGAKYEYLGQRSWITNKSLQLAPETENEPSNDVDFCSQFPTIILIQLGPFFEQNKKARKTKNSKIQLRLLIVYIVPTRF